MEWRPCQWPGYEVSESGQLRNKRGRLLKPQPHKDGYVVYCTHIGGRGCHLYAHQAVAFAWHGPCPQGKEVDHRDKNRRNNHHTNLRYLTKGENLAQRTWPSTFVA